MEIIGLEKSDRCGRGERYDVYVENMGEKIWYFVDFMGDVMLRNRKIVSVNDKPVVIIDITYPRNDMARKLRGLIEG